MLESYKITMLTFPHLKIFTVFSSFPLIFGAESIINKLTSVDVDHSIIDGAQYIKSVIHGEKVSENPGILMFTAPYKLCEGGCNGSSGSNFALAFPLFVGQRGIDAYKKIYHKDYHKIHRSYSRAPFKRRTTRTIPTTTTTTTTPAPTTTCKVVKIYVLPTTEPPPPPTTTMCPFIPPGVCMKRKKMKHTNSTTETDTTTISGHDLIDTLIHGVENNTRNVEDSFEQLMGEIKDVKTLFYSDEIISSLENKIKQENYTSDFLHTTETPSLFVTDTLTTKNDAIVPVQPSEHKNPERNLNSDFMYPDYSLNNIPSTIDILPEPSTTASTSNTDQNIFADLDELNNNIDVSVLRQGNQNRRMEKRDDTDTDYIVNNKYAQPYPYNFPTYK